MTTAKRIMIAERFLEQATATPDRPALIFPDVTFSYGQLQSLVAAFALRFRAEGLGPSKALHIQTDDPAVSLPAVLAAALLGVRVTAVPGSDPSLVVVTTKVPSPAAPHVLVDHSFSPAHFDAEETQAVWTQSAADPDGPWFQCERMTVVGAQSFPTLGQGEIVERALRCRERLGDQTPRVAVLFPVTSYLGLTRRLATLFRGGCLIEGGALQSLAENAVTEVSLPSAACRGLVGVTPDLAFQARCEVPGLGLAESEVEALLRLFSEVSVVLDLAETGPVIVTTFRKSGWTVEASQTLAGPTEIVDLAGAPSHLGRLRVKLDETAEDWTQLAIAARQTEGRLELLGPAVIGNPILVGGMALDAELLDAVISSTEGLVEAVAFASPKAGQDEILAFAIFEDGVNRHHVVRRVENACREAFGPAAVPAKIRPINAIPLQADGRPDRKVCAEMILRAAQV